MELRNIKRIGIPLAAVCLVGCKGSDAPSNVPDYSCVLDQDTVRNVCHELMSSDNSLWEDSIHRKLFIGDGESVPYLNDALAENMVFVKTFSMHDDQIVIYDAYQHQIAMFNLNGEMDWAYGAQGEGPEHYSGSIEGVLNRHGLTIRDSSLSKLDLVGLDGQLHTSLVISGVQTGIALSDGRLCAISSWDSADGIVSIYDAAGVIDYSFGDDSDMYEMPSMPYYRFCALNESEDLIAFASYKHTYICIADISNQTVGFFSRNYPFRSPSFEEVATEAGSAGIRVYPNINSVFVGPDGMINIQILVPNLDGEFASALVNYDRDYTVVDRFNWRGQYLDTYLIPMPRIGSLTYSDGYFYARSYDDDLIYRFPVFRCE